MRRLNPFLPLLLLASGGLFACGGAVPDAKQAAATYADAAEKGDADALWGMLSEEGKKATTKEALREKIAASRAELADAAKAVRASGTRVEATAKLRFQDGEYASLVLRDGHYWVGTAGALPGGALSPEEALDHLRRALARRSYPALLRVLRPETRAAVEADLRSMVEGLEAPETLDVKQTGDNATVVVPGGHVVKLRRDDGVWHIEEFD